MKFKIGDEVKIFSKNTLYFGKIGKITSIYSNGDKCYVEVPSIKLQLAISTNLLKLMSNRYDKEEL